MDTYNKFKTKHLDKLIRNLERCQRQAKFINQVDKYLLKGLVGGSTSNIPGAPCASFRFNPNKCKDANCVYIDRDRANANRGACVDGGSIAALEQEDAYRIDNESPTVPGKPLPPPAAPAAPPPPPPLPAPCDNVTCSPGKTCLQNTGECVVIPGAPKQPSTPRPEQPPPPPPPPPPERYIYKKKLIFY